MLEKNELLLIVGGASISGAIITAVTKAVTVVFDLGRALGTSIRMIVSKKKCSL